MKNVERVGDTNIVGLHTANHNERGNPHPQYVRRNINGLTGGLTMLGGWSVGDGSMTGGYRFDGDFLDAWFRYVMPSTMSGNASYMGVNIPADFSSPGLGTHAGTGFMRTSTGGTNIPLTIMFAGGSGFRIYKAEVPATEVTSGSDYGAGRIVSGLIRVRT